MHQDKHEFQRQRAARRAEQEAANARTIEAQAKKERELAAQKKACHEREVDKARGELARAAERLKARPPARSSRMSTRNGQVLEG